MNIFLNGLSLIKNKKKLIYFALLNLLISISDVVSISLLASIILKFFSPEFIGNKFFFNLSQNSILLILIGIFFSKLFFISISSFIHKKYLEEQSMEIKLQIIKSINSKSILNFDHSKMYSLIFIQVDKFIYGYLEPILNLLSHLIIAFAIIAMLFYNNYIFSIISILYFIIFAYLYDLFLRKNVTKLGKKTVDFYLEFSKNFKSLFEAIIEIKIYNRENFFYKKINNNFKKIKNLNSKYAIYSNLPKPYFEFVTIIFFSLIIFFKNNFNINNDQFFYTISLFSISFLRVLPSINSISASFQSLNYSNKVIFEIKKFLKISKNKILNKELKINKKKYLDIKIDSIILKNINFKYKNIKILNNFSYKFHKNNIYLISGPSGVGKSTLINLILGFLKPQSGKIEYISNSKQFTNIDSQFSVVPSKVGILNDTFQNNITLNYNLKNKSNTLKKIVNLLRLYDIKNKNLLNYPITDEGKNLSNGQKKRVSIARSIYFNRSIQIFDESTNSIEPKLENNFLKYLGSIKKNKIIIIISHNSKIKKHADKVINLI